MAVGGVEQTWEALVNGNLIYSGHYGSEIISLVTDDGHDYMLDKRSISFVPMNTLVDVEDTKGLTTIGAFLYVLIYTTLCVFYIVNLCAVFVKRAIRKKKHAFGN
ncbi:hypothetical protein [Paenibacillus baekrokdamisoli]|nr:hypothetical protein [Paenibacillus baekrokdamisoli]